MGDEVFKAKWAGSPLVVAPPEALLAACLPSDVQHFLGTIGLPSNARWFDKSAAAIMSFDCVATLRLLIPTDVSKRTLSAISSMGPLRIIGIYSSVFIVIDRSGMVWMINGKVGWGKGRRSDPDADGAGWWGSLFLNRNVQSFANCLIEYKRMREVFDEEEYDFHKPAIRDAVTQCRRAMERYDDSALASSENYWTQIIDEVDVW